MIDVDKIQIGDKLKVLCPSLLGNEVYPIVSVVDSDPEADVQGFWIHKDKVAKSNLQYGEPHKLTLVATNTKYSDISEGDIVEIACLSDEQINKWDCEYLIGKQGVVTKKSKSVHVNVGNEGVLTEWCLQPENIRVVEKVTPKSGFITKTFDGVLKAAEAFNSQKQPCITFPSGATVEWDKSHSFDPLNSSEIATQDNEGVFDPSLETRKNGKIKTELLETGFPNAMMALAEVMTWAAEYKDYKPNDWKNVPDAKNAFLAAAARHRIKRMKGEDCDNESKLPHLYHEAFNVMAQLELLITGKLE